MWLLALFLLFVSSALFVFNLPIKQALKHRLNIQVTSGPIKACALALFALALIINIVHWKAESAVILTITLFGPFMFFAILSKAKS